MLEVPSRLSVSSVSNTPIGSTSGLNNDNAHLKSLCKYNFILQLLLFSKTVNLSFPERLNS